MSVLPELPNVRESTIAPVASRPTTLHDVASGASHARIDFDFLRITFGVAVISHLFIGLPTAAQSAAQDVCDSDAEQIPSPQLPVQSAGQLATVSPTSHEALPHTETTGHNNSDGVTALHVPLQVRVPEFVIPQLFGAETHAVPYPTGTSGVVAVHEPEQVIVPVFVAPQAFGAELQLFP